MPQQNFNNHAKYYPAHHFIFYPLILVAIGVSLYYYYEYPSMYTGWLGVGIALIFITWLSFMVRQHYALGNQNRIVRLEMRLRYYILTQQRFEPLEEKLSFGQVAALRFASDEELLSLLKRTLDENLTPAAIKQSIKNWQADGMRV